MEHKKTFGLFAGSIALIYAADVLHELRMQRQGKSPIWMLDTKGTSFAATVGSSWLMELMAGGMVSHHPDFSQIPKREDYELFRKSVSPIKSYDYTRLGRKQPNFWDYALAHSVLGIQEAAVFGLDRSVPNIESFHWAFRRNGESDIWMSSKLISEPVKILVDTTFDVWALNPKDLTPVPTRLSGPYNRFDPKLKQLRQF